MSDVSTALYWRRSAVMQYIYAGHRDAILSTYTF